MKMKLTIMLFFIIFSCCSVQASAWAYLASSPTGNKSYAIRASGSPLLPLIWFKTTDAHGVTLILSKDVIDCQKGRYSIKEINRYEASGKVTLTDSYTFNNWNEITPDSLASYEYKFACKRKLFQ